MDYKNRMLDSVLLESLDAFGAVLIVLTGGQMAYPRPDGVKVIPLGCLKD